MAYDIHIGETVSRHQYVFSIEDQSHRDLFLLISKTGLGLPYLNRMSDFYTDARYSNHDLAVLLSEIILLQNSVPLDLVDIKALLQNFKDTVEKAIRTKQNVYGFCD